MTEENSDMSATSTAQNVNDTAEQLFTDAIKSIQSGDFNAAEKLLNQSASMRPTPKAYHNLAVIRYQQGRNKEAVKFFSKATAIDPNYHASHINLMRMCAEAGNISAAIRHGMRAVQTQPSNNEYKAEFLGVLEKKKLYFFNPALKVLITSCLEAPDFNSDKIHHPWLAILGLDPQLSKIYKLSRIRDYGIFEFYFDRFKSIEALKQPYFLLGLEKVMVPNIPFERFVTFLRRVILRDFYEIEKSRFDDKYLPIIRAMSVCCFNTDYIFDVSEKEKKYVERLRNTVMKSADTDKILTELVLLACYEPVRKLPDSANYKTAHDAYETFFTVHIAEPAQEEKIKASIVSLTQTDAQVSQSVKDQYEEFPYPRWRFPGFPIDNVIIEKIAGQDNLKMLVAGTGTGQEPVHYALALPKADILGIDLSFSSLSYAIRKTQQFNIKNITYRQADILGLKAALKPEYDFIVSSGVLHHMKDPLEGLDTLLGLLKPGGYMQIALYSETARRSIVRAREIIREKGLSGSSDDIKAFRRSAQEWLSADEYRMLSTMRDYYSMPECRDLLFHVMEHRFTIPQLEDIITARKLKLLSFGKNGDRAEQYYKMYPQDPDGINLKNWHAFEQKHPDIFRGMYFIYLQKPD